MIYKILNFCGNAFLLHNILKILYPEWYSNVVISIGFKLLRLFSYLEITFKKIKNMLISNMPEVNDSYVTEYILNGHILNKVFGEKIENKDFEELKMNMVLFKKYIKNNNNQGKIYVSMQETIKPSNVKFMSLELFTHETEYQIKLETDTHSYYTENMIIDKLFLEYYLINELDKNIHLNDDYKLMLVDNDVNIHELTRLSKIAIYENTYKIL